MTATIAPNRPGTHTQLRQASSIAPSTTGSQFPKILGTGRKVLPAGEQLNGMNNDGDNDYDSVPEYSRRSSPSLLKQPPIPSKGTLASTYGRKMRQKSLGEGETLRCLPNFPIIITVVAADALNMFDSSYSPLYARDQEVRLLNARSSSRGNDYVPPTFPLNHHDLSSVSRQHGNKKHVDGDRRVAGRNSIQAHITPSPSDSGIVDYETLIRDKENELSSVRLAMEQNEEVLVRVHKDKERQLRDEIDKLKDRLHTCHQNEDMLRFY